MANNTRLYIPEKLHLGFQNRKDTYTGKLAFITYTDAKGKFRSQTSWERWRDKNIKPEHFDNEPTEGFVLNKKVGDYRSSWGGRRAWIRVYDPRNFELEISVENLVFILEECSAIKGKGLEGEFVWAWDRNKHVLLPCTSQEYQESKKHTQLQKNTITKDDMLEGCLYKTRDGQTVMYLGYHPYYYQSKRGVRVELTPQEKQAQKRAASRRYGYNNGWYNNYKYVDKTTNHKAKRHIFINLDGKKYTSPDHRDRWNTYIPYWVQTGYTSLGERLTTEPDPRYAAEYEKFIDSRFGNKPETKKKVKK